MKTSDIIYKLAVGKSALIHGSVIPVKVHALAEEQCGQEIERGKSIHVQVRIGSDSYKATVEYPDAKKRKKTLRLMFSAPLKAKMQSLYPTLFENITKDTSNEEESHFIYVCKTDTKKVFEIVPDFEVDIMTPDERKAGFSRYLIRIGLIKSSTTYPNHIEQQHVKDIVKENYDVSSMYEIADASKVLALHPIVKAKDKELKKHGQASCAMLKYADYLQSLNKRTISPLTADELSLIGDNLKYLIAAKAKPFLILGGFSGTGKSQKVKELAYLTCPQLDGLQDGNEPGNYCLISVKPNWHDSTELLGYYSSISQKYVCTDFMRFIVKAMSYPEVPFFVCLDEMNLAPVEEYLAEYLSVLESRKNVEGTIVSSPLVSAGVFNASYKENIFENLGLNLEEEEAKSIQEQLQQNGLCLPQNVIVIGTVNMDDTTNSFSRKVIDRAITFETEIETFSVESYFDQSESLVYRNLDSTRFICDQVKVSDAVFEEPDLLSDTDKETIIKFMNDINEKMAGSPFQVSYRVLNETILLYRSIKKLTPSEANLEQVFSTMLLTKVLPRIEGDSDRVKAPLEGLRDYVESGDKDIWKPVAEKIAYMLKPFENSIDGFTRFWI